MGLMDGEEPTFSVEQITAHTTNCENCRREIEQLESAMNLFAGQERRGQEADLWANIETRIKPETKTASQFQLKIFLALGALLIGYKLLELLPANDLGFLFKLVPLIFVAVVFLLLKENPFKINAELRLER